MYGGCVLLDHGILTHDKPHDKTKTTWYAFEAYQKENITVADLGKAPPPHPLNWVKLKGKKSLQGKLTPPPPLPPTSLLRVWIYHWIRSSDHDIKAILGQCKLANLISQDIRTVDTSFDWLISYLCTERTLTEFNFLQTVETINLFK